MHVCSRKWCDPRHAVERGTDEEAYTLWGRQKSVDVHAGFDSAHLGSSQTEATQV